MKRLIPIFGMIVCCLMISTYALAQESATPQEVYDMVVKGMEVLQQLEDEGLSAFMDRKGEFVWKDSYVFVIQCPGKMLAHPIAYDKLKDLDLNKAYPFIKLFCKMAEKPSGGWVVYMWPKPGEKKESRKIAFCVTVPGKPYVVVAGIYDDKVSVDELNASLNSGKLKLSEPMGS